MSVPDFEHEFDAEAEVCFQQFKSDSISYLMCIGQLYNEELERLRLEYTKFIKTSRWNTTNAGARCMTSGRKGT